MARRQKYGKTWWGNAWVEAMHTIDRNTNRLPRGKTYANRGSVETIKVASREVRAAVQGRKRAPYQIRFHLRPFSAKEKKRVVNSIKEDPSLQAQLALGRLPQEILELLESFSIHLLPTSWKDIEASCSCPDWANPCKHLAAVYYLLANEIDQDPFLLFHLRGLSPEEIVKQELLEIERVKEPLLDYSEVEVREIERGEMPSLIFDPKKAQAIFSLLPSQSSFYDGDIKEELLKNYRRSARELGKLDLMEDISPLVDEEVTLLIQEETPSSPGKPEIFLYPGKREEFPSSKRGVETILLEDEGSFILKEREGLLVEFSSFIQHLLKIPLSQVSEYSPSLAFMVEAIAVAQAMVVSSSLLPNIKRDAEGNFSIIYEPYLATEETQEALQYLVTIYPQDVMLFHGRKVLPGKRGVERILSFLLTEMIHMYSRADTMMSQVFFKGREYRVEGFTGRQLAKALSHWLLLLHVPKASILPLLKVESVGETRFSLKVFVEDKEDPLAPLISLEELFIAEGEVFSRRASQVQSQISRQLTLASDSYPPLKRVLSSRGEMDLVLTGMEIYVFLEDLKEGLQLLGIKVMLPKEMRHILHPQLSIKAEGGGEAKMSYFKIEEALTFSWQIAIGDTIISREEFKRLTSSAEGIVRFREGYLLLDPEEVKRIFKDMERPLPSLDSSQILKGALSGEVEGTPFFAGEKLEKLLEEFQKAPSMEVPEGLRGELRPYQILGYQWLYSHVSKGFGTCLADDMGLGKTIQAIALILKLKEEGGLKAPALIICPTTLAGNWYKEVERFAPSMRASIYHGQNRRLERRGYDIIITTYGIVRQEMNRFRTTKWSLVLLDEAQNIKNPLSQQSKAVKSLKGEGFLAMTGTPVENRLSELWSIFDFLNKGYLGSQKDFIKRFALPIERYRDKKKVEVLKKITSPFILRRVKSDRTIIQDLPPKVVENEYCTLTTEQAALYQEVVESGTREMERKDGIERRGLIFKLMTSLKQICNHPVQYSKKGVPQKRHSGKAQRTIELLKEIMEKKEKALLFTQYKEMGGLLQAMIEEELSTTPLFFHGSLSREKREDLIGSFQDGPSSIFIISLKAGGTGLNLTAASHVIHYDLWWNPAVEDQATDRTYRIGQDKRVLVKRLITLGTFEEKIYDIIEKKKELANLTLSTGEGGIFQLSNEEIKELLSLRM